MVLIKVARIFFIFWTTCLINRTLVKLMLYLLNWKFFLGLLLWKWAWSANNDWGGQLVCDCDSICPWLIQKCGDVGQYMQKITEILSMYQIVLDGSVCDKYSYKYYFVRPSLKWWFLSMSTTSEVRRSEWINPMQPRPRCRPSLT